MTILTFLLLALIVFGPDSQVLGVAPRNNLIDASVFTFLFHFEFLFKISVRRLLRNDMFGLASAAFALSPIEDLQTVRLAVKSLSLIV